MTDTLQTQLRISLDEIRPGSNDRRTFDPVKLSELANSIYELGLGQPVSLRHTDDEQRPWRLIMGERRYRAYCLLRERHPDDERWWAIPANTRDVDPVAERDLMLVENVQRVDLNPIEEALGYQDALARHGTIEAVSKVTGIKTSRIRWRLDLLRLDPDIMHLVAVGDLGAGYAWEMYQLEPAGQRLAFAAYRAKPDMGLAGLRTICQRLLTEQVEQPMFGDDLFRVQEMVEVAAKPTRASIRNLSALVARLSDELEARGGDPDLILEARTLIGK